MNEVISSFSALLVGGMAMISIGLWSHVVRCHRSGKLHFFSAEKRLKLPLGLVDVLLAFVLWMLGQMVGLAITFAIMGVEQLDPASMSSDEHTVLGFAVGICTMASTGLTLAYLYGRYKNPYVFGLTFKRLANDIGLGLLVFMCFVPVTFLVQAALTQIWEYEHPTLDLISPDSSMLTILSAWWMAVIVAPISEEIFFRAILQGWLSRLFIGNVRPEAPLVGGWPHRKSEVDLKIPTHSTAESETQAVRQSQEEPLPQRGGGTAGSESDESSFYVARAWAPVVVSSLLFALVHLGQGPAPIPIFVFGLGLGLIYRQTGRILPCITAHFLLNLFSVSVFTIDQLYFPGDAVQSAPALKPAMAFFTSWLC